MEVIIEIREDLVGEHVELWLSKREGYEWVNTLVRTQFF